MEKMSSLLGKTADQIYDLRILSKEEYEDMFPFGSSRELVFGAACYLVGCGKGRLELSHVYAEGGSVWVLFERFARGGYEKVEVLVPARRSQIELDIQYGMRASLID
jgi:hypothetical protein